MDGLSPDWRHNIAYYAALQLAQAALAASGYRATRDHHHLRVIASLEFTLRLDAATIRRLDTARKRRNRAEYNAAGSISSAESDEVHAFARELRSRVETWLRSQHTDLIV